MALIPAALFLRRNKPMVQGIVAYINKQQHLHAKVIELLTGKPFPVGDIVVDKLLAAVDAQGPQVIERVLLAVDKQMDTVWKTIDEAVAAAIAEQSIAAPVTTTAEEATMVGPAPVQVVVADEPEPDAQPDQPPM